MTVVKNNGAGNTQLGWWQPGSTQQKGNYFKNITVKDIITPAVVQASKSYAKTEGLINERNKFYAINKDLTKAPKFTFLEAASLYGKGYAGVFGRSQSNQTVGLLGEDWQQAYALDALRKGKDMLDFSVMDTKTGTTKDELAMYKQVEAADQSNKTWTNLFTLYGAYQKMGGDAGYAKRYGNGLPPSKTSKYGILTHLDDKAIRSDDVQATYQANLSAQLEQAAKATSEMIAKEPKLAGLQQYSDTLRILANDGKIKTGQKIGKPNQDKIRIMENAVMGLRHNWDSQVEKAVGASAPSYSKDAITSTLNTIPEVGTLLAAGASTDLGYKIADATLGKVNALANSDLLAPTPINWNNWSIFGNNDVNKNVVTGLARFGIGMVPGVFQGVEEGQKASSELKKTLTSNHEFGKGVDFQLGDAMWADMAQRYYDPFAYKTNAKGEQVFQGYWGGYTTADSWQKFGNKVAMDPVTYTLDVLSVVPVVGWAGKAADVASIASKVGRGAGIGAKVAEQARVAEEARVAAGAEATAAEKAMPRIDLKHLTTDEQAAYLDAHKSWVDTGTEAYQAAHDTIAASPEQAAAEAKVKAALDMGMNPSNPEFPKTPLDTLSERFANQVIHGLPEPKPFDFAKPRLLDSSQSVLDALAKDPSLIEVLDETQIRNAAAIVEQNRAATALSEAEAAVLDANDALRGVPSVRRFRSVARKAMAGDVSSQETMAKWKVLGYEFNNAENSMSLRFSSKFEARTKVLEAPKGNIFQSDRAMIRLPASPIARGIKEGVLWAGKYIIDPAGAKIAEAGKATGIEAVAKLTNKFVDMPRLGYRWNYTKAVEDALHADWGDNAQELGLAADNYKLATNTNLVEGEQQAILSELYGGRGAASTTAPNLRRTAIHNELDSITEGGKFVQAPDGTITSKFIPGTEDQAQALIAKRNTMLSDELGTIDERAAAFDEFYQSRRLDLRRRLADSSYKATDTALDEMVNMYRRLKRQQENISNRLVHTETNANNIEALRHVYTEAMNGLEILPKHLFGDGVKGSGKIGKFVKRVVRLNGTIIPHITGLYGTSDEAIINAAQKAKGEGLVFDRLAADEANAMKDEWVKFVRHITGEDSSAGLFRRGDSHPNAEAAPVAVLAESQKGVPKGFTRIHIPKLRHSIDGPNLTLGKIIDTGEEFIIPNEALVTTKVAKRARKVHVLDPTSGRDMLETGSLNAMSDIYPQARFYSEKVSENGLYGIRQNEAQVKNEHVVATSGLREHSLQVAIRSEVNHYMARMQDSIVRQAEENAVLVLASEVAGKTSAQSGYKILKMLQVFDNVDNARAFAHLRGVGKEFDAAVSGAAPTVSSFAEAPEGLSRIMINGQEQFVVRGSMADWATHVGEEDLNAHSIMSDYKARHYADPNNISSRGMVLALPNSVDKKISLMAIEGNTYATRLFDNAWAKVPTSVFKWFVLNARLGFIDANVVGGSAMMMMRNPMAAAKILARLIAKNAKLAGDSQFANWAGDSAAMDRVLAWEDTANIYKQDSGIGAGSKEPNNLADFSSKSRWIKKYIFNGGYTTVAAFERMVRNAVGVDFLTSDAGFRAFMDSPEVTKYIREGVDYTGEVRPMDGSNPISRFEAATNMMLDRNSPFFNQDLQHRLRYTTNTVSGNYHRFSPFETMLRNFAMPFYAWQRHSLAYTWRMAVDKPITANVLYKVGQQGYTQVAEQGIPDYMRQTIPLPSVLKEHLSMLPADFRIDASNINPFGTATNMVASLYSVLQGDNTGESVFQFANPYLNNLIKDQLGIDPVTKRIDWARLASQDQNGGGIWNTTLGMFGKVTDSTVFGSAGKIMDAVDNSYAEDGLANQYSAITSADDALKILDGMYTTDANGNPVSKGMTGWSLKIPNQRTTEPSNQAMDVINALGFKSTRLNMETLNDQSRKEYVAAMALAFYNNKKMADAAVRDMSRVQSWQTKRDYVQQVWLPAARAQGVDEGTIQIVLLKLQKERPKGGSAVDPNLLLATMGG